ncbi:MAG: hypothetical protein AAFU61_07795 [Pseudomonadota bacterium]
MTLDPNTLEILEVVEQPLRAVFEQEALVFTPWLARPENLDRLGRAIGVDLYDMKREQSSGTFRVDGLARRREDDALVVIENQFHRSDHDHLGKSLTYLAAFDAKLVIWMAEAFADEHVQALRWLNDHTPPEIGFFGVVPKAVRIGDSQPALRFDVAMRPNTAVKRAEEAKRLQDASIFETREAYWPVFQEAAAADPELAGVSLRFGGRLGFMHLLPDDRFAEDPERPGVLAFLNASVGAPSRIGIGLNRAASDRASTLDAEVEAIFAAIGSSRTEETDFSDHAARRAAAVRHLQMAKPIIALLRERLGESLDLRLGDGPGDSPPAG